MATTTLNKTVCMILLFIGSFLLVSYSQFSYQFYQRIREGNRLGFNVTNSERKGIYKCSPLKNEPQLNEIVGFFLPRIDWIQARKYLHSDQILIKHIGAVPGEYLFTVKNGIYACKDQFFSSHCRELGRCLPFDHKNRQLSCYAWKGYPIPKNYYYLQATHDPYSLDSRYFGLIPLSNMKYITTWLFDFNFIPFWSMA